MTGPLPIASDAPLASEDELLDHLLSGARPSERWGVGLEFERLPLDPSSGRAIPFDGDRGVEAALRALAARSDWAPAIDQGRVIGLLHGDASIALEPGAQLEMSGRVHADILSLRAELAAHLRESAEIAAPLGIAWVPVGLHPISPIDEIPWVPKSRYAVMGPYLGARGALAHHMMKGTAGVQLNFDVSGDADAAEKLRVATAISPIVTAAAANSPIAAARPAGMLTRRAHIWTETDPARCGLVESVLRPDATTHDWLEYALDVPVMFVQRAGRYVTLDGIPFRLFLREGRGGLRATLADWVLHLTTIFTEVRLKTYLEVRGADSVDPDLAVALAALWKGILYDARARRAAWDLVAAATYAERVAFLHGVAREGPAARLRGVPALELALELTRLARAGLSRFGAAGASPGLPGEADLIAPLESSLSGAGGCPAARLLDRWGGHPRPWADLAARSIRAASAFAEEFAPDTV